MKCPCSSLTWRGGTTIAKARPSTPQSARLRCSSNLLPLARAGKVVRLLGGIVDWLGESGISNGVFPDGGRQFGVQFAGSRKQEKDHHEEAWQGQVDDQIRPPADAYQVGVQFAGSRKQDKDHHEEAWQGQVEIG